MPYLRVDCGVTITEAFSVGLKADRRKVAIKGALKYASWGHKFPFTSYPDTEIAFCSSEGKKIVTYCMGCKNRLFSHGISAIHLLECLSLLKPIERPVRPVLHWANRLWLAIRTNSKVTDPAARG